MTAVVVIVLVVLGLTALVFYIEKGRKSDLDQMNGYEIHESFQQRQARKRFKPKR